MTSEDECIMLLIDELIFLLNLNEDSERVNYLIEELFEYINKD